MSSAVGLQEWLDGEIKRIQRDISLLETAISRYNSYRDLYLRGNRAVIENPRYSHLTSEEIETKVAEDSKKFKALLKQLELMFSASKLDIAEVVLRCDGGQSFWKPNIVREIPDPYLELKHEHESKRIVLYLGSRILKIRCRKINDPIWNHYDEYIIEGVINIYWTTPGRITIKLSSGKSIYVEHHRNGYIQMVND